MVRIDRPLPGEFDGTLDPRDHDFGVLPTEPSPESDDQKVAAFYRRTRLNSGVDIPALNPHLTRQPYDPEPAALLLARHEALAYPYACTFGDAALEVDEGVFCPTLTNASPFLLAAIDVKPGERVLDAFAGSGAFGVHAALRGARVVAFDASGPAVACARKNVALNGVGETVDVRHGTLGQTMLPKEVFDLVIANPPLVPGEPAELLEGAVFDPGLHATADFIAALPGLLAKGGRCYLLTSDVIDRDGYRCDIASLCRTNGLKMSVVAQLHRAYESYRVHKIERRWSPVSRLVSLF